MTKAWRSLVTFAAMLLIGSTVAAQAPTPKPIATQSASRPNFVILLMDDVALMDIGAFGGEARTPNIDALARRGRMFANYYSSPLCSPSRAMLLTGLDNHRTGVATIEEVIPKEHIGKPGYSLRFEPGVETIAARLKRLGYRTYMTGKWHLGHGKGDLPNAHGFDRSFALDASGADNWEDKPYMPYYAKAPWFENGKPVARPDGVYSSRFLVDRMIAYLDSGASKDPFLAYIGFQAAHIPVQAPARFTRHYLDTYTDGWDKLRVARWTRAQQSGLIPKGAPLAAMPASTRRWADLSKSDKALYARNMAINAGMIEAMDHHIGRLVAHLRKTGHYDDTVFIVASDNGPDPSSPFGSNIMAMWMATHGYTVSAGNLGERGTFAFIGPEWANAAASPGDLFKFYTAEGGIHVPLVMAGPGIASGAPARAMTLVSDIAPTIFQMAGGTPMSKDFDGISLVPLLAGNTQTIRPPAQPIGMEVGGNAALFRDGLKLVRNIAPYGDGRWRLFDIATDPGETRDLRNTRPQIFAALMRDYQAYARRVGVLEMPPGYSSTQEIANKTRDRLLARYWWVMAIAAALLIAAIAGLVLLVRRRVQRRA